ncbi:DUF87 domain-containing protein [Candidatus Woesearchaeota archaeon]|nr:DUF87 domain-containing protein [Candidatus Woesearchaeota archaeon]
MGEKGVLVSGEFGSLCARQKHGECFELGELLVAKSEDEETILLQVFDLLYGSQLGQQNLELISGLRLEEGVDTELIDPSSRTYVLARLKSLLAVKDGRARSPKTLPRFFSPISQVTADDVRFLSSTDGNALLLGQLRSGTKKLDVPVHINGSLALSHHVLIAGTTGRGKSVLMSNLLWHASSAAYCGMLVLDPHDEYYGRSGFGLKDHPHGVAYYSSTPPVGAHTLKINLHAIRSADLLAVFDWSDAQRDALRAYEQAFGQQWILEVVRETPLEHARFNEATLAVVKRRLLSILSLDFDGSSIRSRGAFDPVLGQNTISDVVRQVTSGMTVIIDTSSFSGAVEVLIASLFARAILAKYKRCSSKDLQDHPVVSIVLEEAPRVLGKEVLEKGPNIFSTIAREGRKFKVGLVAITQLPSLIPRAVLANLNTKIILGIELRNERQAIIESAAQDLSDASRMIASLDRGEAIVSSNFLSFAAPIMIPMFDKKLLPEVQGKRYFGDFS